MKKIKVLIIDDSAMVRKILTAELSNDKEIEIVGTAPDPIIGRDKIVELKPDVIILDVEMPRMDGLTFLSKLMKHFPLPVIIVSSLAEKGGEVALKAIELGAVEVLSKPGVAYSVKDMGEQLCEKVKAASKVVIKKREVIINKKRAPIQMLSSIGTTNKIIAIGASTGGTEAIKEILTNLPRNMPPILIVQHMPANFTTAFAERLNKLSKLTVKEAKDGDMAIPGTVLLAPGNRHMTLHRSGRNYFVKLNDGPLIFHQRPAVELLFTSVAKNAGKNAIGVILTGMGKDGAHGMLNMKQAGAKTIAQNEKSSIVFGMPKEAILQGGVDYVISLEKIGESIIKILKK